MPRVSKQRLAPESPGDAAARDKRSEALRQALAAIEALQPIVREILGDRAAAVEAEARRQIAEEMAPFYRRLEALERQAGIEAQRK